MYIFLFFNVFFTHTFLFPPVLISRPECSQRTLPQRLKRTPEHRQSSARLTGGEYPYLDLPYGPLMVPLWSPYGPFVVPLWILEKCSLQDPDLPLFSLLRLVLGGRYSVEDCFVIYLSFFFFWCFEGECLCKLIRVFCDFFVYVFFIFIKETMGIFSLKAEILLMFISSFAIGYRKQ